MSIAGLELPNKPFVGYYVNKAGGKASMHDLDLISHIADNLYVGGCYHDVDLGDFFSHVFSLYQWERYKIAPGTIRKEVKMYDSRTDPIDIETINSMSDEIVEALDAGGNVLVHCQAGLNRSNLVATLVLIKKWDYSVEDAIALLRHKRSPHVLANQTFEDYLRDTYE
jgi:hypothetical protein